MGWLEGLLGGFTQSKGEYETRMREEGAQSSAREAKIFEALLNSPDKETRDLATAGLLQSAQPTKRKGGFRGWLGEMESSPYLQQIRNLSPEVADEAPPSAAPSGAPGVIATPPAAGGSLAQSPTAATQVGAPPLTAIEPGPSEQTVRGGGAGGEGMGVPPSPAIATPPAAAVAGPPSSTMRPRQVFQTEEQQTLGRYSAQEKGEILGVVAAYEAVGVPHDQAVKNAIEERMRSRGVGGASGAQSIAGQLADGSPAFGVFDRALRAYVYPAGHPKEGQPIPGFQPRTTTGSKSYGADREAIAMEAEFGGKPYSQQTPEMRTRIGQEVIRRGGEKAGAVTTGRGEAAAAVPLATPQRISTTAELAGQWTKATTSRNEMQRQYSLMQTGVLRYDADPIGSSQAVLVTFQKMLDPTSVVRESEYARSAQGLSLADWVLGKAQQYREGGVGVPKPVLEEMAKTAAAFLTSDNMKSALDNVRQRLVETASDPTVNIDLKQVFGPQDLQGIVIPTRGGQVGAPPPQGAAAAGPAGPGAEWTMVNGVLHHNGVPVPK